MTTLEDFFTRTEMQDGLSDVVRVEELLQVVQNVNDGFLNNLSDAIRQWSTVASTLAATQNNECLNHFVQLDGLCFLNRWLREALDFNANVSVDNMKELIDKLLASLERLPIHNDKLTASGIAINVQRLLHHEDGEIMRKASLLCDKWNLVSKTVTSTDKLEEGDASQGDLSGCPTEEGAEDGLHEADPIVISSSKEDGKGQANENENVTAKCHHSESSHPLSMKEDIPVSDQSVPSASLNPNDASPALGDANSSATLLASNSAQDLLRGKKESSVCADSGFASTNGYVMQGHRDGNVDNQCRTVSKAVCDSINEMNTDPVSEKSPYHSSPTDAVDNLLSSVASGSEALLVGAEQAILPSKVIESNSTEIVESQPEGGAIDIPLAKCSTIMESMPLTEASGLPQEQCITTNTYSTTSPQYSCQRNGSDVIDGLLKDHTLETNVNIKKENDSTSDSCNSSLKFTSDSSSLKLTSDSCDSSLKLTSDSCDSSLKLTGPDTAEEIDHTSESEFMFVDDALEVARQVAIEVEREVVDYREAFCSSPEVNSGEDGCINSSGSHEGNKQDHKVTEEAGQRSSSSEKENSLDSSSSKERPEVAQSVNSDLENVNQGLQSQKLDSPAQESVEKSETDKCDLDLNADIINEEHGFVNTESNMPVNVSAPVAIVAPSRGASVLPVTLQFEGGMGWKGTAATSAFRPASPRRTSESEKTDSISKQKRTFLDIDLNVAESEDEVVGQLSVKQMPCSLPSGDSYTEVSSLKADKLKLDLNRLGDEDASVCPTQFKFHQHGEQSLSSASSSSKHLSVRDFDLNDNPSFLDVGSSQNFDKFSKSSDTFGASNLKDPVITIMGSKMVVGRKEFGNQVQQLFPTNGFNMEHSAVGEPSMPWVQMPPPVYSFTGVPTGSTLSAPQAFYSAGNFPYIDARGQTFIPQTSGASGYNGPTTNRPPLFMNVPAAASNPAVYGSVRPGFDMNAGMSLFDTSAKGVSFGQLLFHGHNNLLEDQTKATPQSSSSVLPLKRKEPDSGWESHPYGYKQMI